eukprot:scaffold1452_cov174-Amphora_coffeaeformis.AAC.8
MGFHAVHTINTRNYGLQVLVVGKTFQHDLDTLPGQFVVSPVNESVQARVDPKPSSRQAQSRFQWPGFHEETSPPSSAGIVFITYDNLEIMARTPRGNGFRGVYWVSGASIGFQSSNCMKSAF